MGGEGRPQGEDHVTGGVVQLGPAWLQGGWRSVVILEGEEGRPWGRTRDRRRGWGEEAVGIGWAGLWGLDG